MCVLYVMLCILQKDPNHISSPYIVLAMTHARTKHQSSHLPLQHHGVCHLCQVPLLALRRLQNNQNMVPQIGKLMGKNADTPLDFGVPLFWTTKYACFQESIVWHVDKTYVSRGTCFFCLFCRTAFRPDFADSISWPTAFSIQAPIEVDLMAHAAYVQTAIASQVYLP